MDSKNGICYTQIRVRYAETDKMGVAYNSHYLTWFEVGRTELLRNIGYTYEELENMGYRLPLIEAGIKYLKPVLYDDLVTIVSKVSEKPGVRLRIVYDIIKDSEVVANGFTEHAFTDESLHPVKPPVHIRNRFIDLWEKSNVV
ncbi:MAG: acyl-CoA thioesterase [Candidatus Latescibacteria bacterium]|nr:acyl-CoA thioesterase [Candidatus Latescibacterota bacterium]